jgi:hypothetical protein
MRLPIRGRRAIAIGSLAVSLVVLSACGDEIASKNTTRPPLNPVTTTLPPFAGTPGRPAVNCSSAYFDSLNLNTSVPLGLPVQFPGAPDGTSLCGVDNATKGVEYTSTAAAITVLYYYATLLTKRSCTAALNPPSTTSQDTSMTWKCGSVHGQIVVAGDAGAYEVLPAK